MQQNWFVMKFTKKCYVQQHFSFCHIWVTWQRCVVCPQYVTADLAFSLYAIVVNLIIPTRKIPFTTTSVALQSCKKEHQKIATTAAKSLGSTVHCGGYLLHNQPFLQSWLHPWVLPPNNYAGSFICCQGWEAVIEQVVLATA